MSVDPSVALDFGGNDDISEDNGKGEEDGEDEDPVASIVNDEDDEDVDEDVDPMVSIVAEVVAGCDPAATIQQRDRMKELMAEHLEYLGDHFATWFKSHNMEERRNAQKIIGYMGMEQILNDNYAMISQQQRNKRAREDDDDGVPVPLGAPPTIPYLLNANQRSKLHRLASTFREKYAVDFFCRHNWPKLDGIMVHINDVKPNKSGASRKDESLKKRSKTQVTVMGASLGALDRFRDALLPQGDYYETTNVAEFIGQLMEDSDDEDSEDNEDSEDSED